MAGQERIFEIRVEGQERAVPVYLVGMGVEEARAGLNRQNPDQGLKPDPPPVILPRQVQA